MNLCTRVGRGLERAGDLLLGGGLGRTRDLGDAVLGGIDWVTERIRG
jgi:hypothetical protein